MKSVKIALWNVLHDTLRDFGLSLGVAILVYIFMEGISLKSTFILIMAVIFIIIGHYIKQFKRIKNN